MEIDFQILVLFFSTTCCTSSIHCGSIGPGRSDPPPPSPSNHPFAGELVGFGEGTRGGEGGPIYTVTSLADSGPGTLREALQNMDGPLRIQFAVDGEIRLERRINAHRSFKTVDGRGRKVFIVNHGIQFGQGNSHFVIRNVHFRRNRGDAFEVRRGSYVWIHEYTFGDTLNLTGSEEPDGVVDIVRESHHITMSYCYAYDHNKAFLISYDRTTQVTFHHNYFRNLVQRTPMVRGEASNEEPGDAWVHVYNNYLESSGPIQCHDGSNLLVENNVFKNGRRWATCENPPFDVCRWGTRSLLVRGSKLIGNMQHASNRNPSWVFQPPYTYTLDSVEEVERIVSKLNTNLL